MKVHSIIFTEKLSVTQLKSGQRSGDHGLIAESNEEFMNLIFREIENRIYSILYLNAR